MNANRDVAALVGRILLASLFVWSGIGKITGFAGNAGFIASKGLPMAELLTVAAIVGELGGGLAIIAGWKVRWSALALIAFTIVASIVFHAFWAVPPEQAMMQQINFMKNTAIIGGLLVLYAHGPGRLAVERDES
jgi:putative oxidoreductase